MCIKISEPSRYIGRVQQFHKTLPKSSSFINRLSVRFYETDSTTIFTLWISTRCCRIFHTESWFPLLKAVHGRGGLTPPSPLLIGDMSPKSLDFFTPALKKTERYNLIFCDLVIFPLYLFIIFCMKHPCHVQPSVERTSFLYGILCSIVYLSTELYSTDTSTSALIF